MKISIQSRFDVVIFYYILNLLKYSSYLDLFLRPTFYIFAATEKLISISNLINKLLLLRNCMFLFMSNITPKYFTCIFLHPFPIPFRSMIYPWISGYSCPWFSGDHVSTCSKTLLLQLKIGEKCFTITFWRWRKVEGRNEEKKKISHFNGW